MYTFNRLESQSSGCGCKGDRDAFIRILMNAFIRPLNMSIFNIELKWQTEVGMVFEILEIC